MNDDAKLFAELLQGTLALARINQIEYQYHPRELVYQQNKVKLYHYLPQAPYPGLNESLATPLLVVFATINRSEILDLLPRTSFIAGLLKNNLDVYLIDWGWADAGDELLSMNHFVICLRNAIDVIREKTSVAKINLLGICQGGIISLCYCALYPQVKNLVLISTPVDFQTQDNLIAHLIKHLDPTEMIAIPGNIPGGWISQFFISLRPFDLLAKKFLHFSDQVANSLDTEKFLYVEKWLRDVPDQPRALFLELINDFYQKNKLIRGEINFWEKNVNLKNITVPILNIMATKDEIIPVSASKALKKYVGSKQYTERKFLAGHIGLYISEKVKNNLTKTIAKWIKKHDNK